MDVDQAESAPYRIAPTDADVLRVIERMEHARIDDKPTRQERRQWAKPAKKPKALRGHP